MIDKIINASIDGVKRSGALEAGCLMGTVTAVSGGTVTVERGSDTYPRVRVLSGYPNPRTGDRVEILRTAGGWVCIGKVQSAAPTIQQGSGTATGSANDWRGVSVTFPHPFSSTPTVVVTPQASPTSGSTTLMAAVSGVSATGFTAQLRRNNDNDISFVWIATNA